MLFHSIEHAYQIQKAHFHGFHYLVNKIGACATAAQAKYVGRTIPSSGRWNSIKSNLVFEFLQLKWSQVPAFWPSKDEPSCTPFQTYSGVQAMVTKLAKTYLGNCSRILWISKLNGVICTHTIIHHHCPVP